MQKRPYIPYVLLAAIAGLIFALSEYIQWYGDSYLYRFDFATGKPIENFWELFPSQYAHYFMMNGRVWVHLLCQGFSSLWGQTAFAFCNAFMYVAFVLLFIKLVGGAWRNVSTLLSCILVILFFTDTSYNANCQIGYIWTSAVSLAFIILYFRARGKTRIIWWKLVLLFILSLFAGNGNEAIAIGVGAALIFDSFTNIRRIPTPQWVMFTGFCIGGLILCLSPGILNRAAGDSANLVYSTYRIIILSRALYILVITVTVLKFRHKLILRKFVNNNLFFFISLASLIVFNFIIGIGTTGRQLFGVELFSAILTIKALKDLTFPKWVLAMFSLIIITIYAMKFEYLHYSNEDLRLLRKEIEETEDGVVFLDFKKYSSFVRPTEVKDMQYAPYFYVHSIHDDIYDKGHFYQLRDSIDITPYPEYKVYPLVFKGILHSKIHNFAVKCADGTYLIVQDRKNPATFVLHRRINLLGIAIPISPYTIEFANECFLNIDSMNVLLERFEIPLVENGEVEIIHNSQCIMHN